MSDVTKEGERLIKDWLAAQESVKNAQSQLNRAECNVKNSEQALGRWLLPEDAEPGEKISVWMGDSLFQGVKDKHGDVTVTVRRRGKFAMRGAT